MKLYIVSSPMHMILALLNNKNPADSICIIIDEENKLYKYQEILKSLFKEVFYINFPKGRFSKYYQFSLYTHFSNKHYSKMKQIFRYKIENIFIFNDYFFGSQLIMKKFPQAKVTYIEDGSSVYNQWIFETNIWRRLFYLIMFGRSVYCLKLLGTHPRINRRLLLYPKEARFELQDEKNDQFNLLSDPKIISDYLLSKTEFCSGLKANIKVLFILSRLDTYNEFDWFEKEIKRLYSLGIKSYVKYHPLGRRRLPLDESMYIEINSEIPIEIFILAKGVDTIYGVPSSALYMIKFLLPKSNVVCISDKEGKLSTSFVKMLRNVGVNCINEL